MGAYEFSDNPMPPRRNTAFATPVLSGQAYNPTTKTFSFTARFCNKATSPSLLGLFSRTVTLTNDNSLTNRTRDGGGTPPGGAGSELDFPITGQYSDSLLAPGECVDVVYQIGLTSNTKFNFYVDVYGYNP